MSIGYHEIYDQDFPVKNISHGWIQWKGTNVCIDLHCECGMAEHYDGEFFYYWSCKCGKSYAVGQNVKLIKLTENQVKEVNLEYGYNKVGVTEENHERSPGQ